MKKFLNFCECPEFFLGIDHVEKCAGRGVLPQRLSVDLRKRYQQEGEKYLLRAETSTGIRIAASGEVKHLHFSARHRHFCREFFGYDLLTPEGFHRNFSQRGMPEDFSFDADFPAGSSGFTLFLPFEAQTEILACTAEYAGTLSPLSFRRAPILFLGDSITQGWEVPTPLESYAGRLAFKLKRDYFNLGVGGMVMQGETAELSLTYPWETALLAFGVNDASRGVTSETFRRETMRALRALHGRGKVYLLTPLWWPDEPHGALQLAENRRILAECAAQFPGTVLIPGETLVPPDRAFFADGVHPNHDGMQLIAENLAPYLAQESE